MNLTEAKVRLLIREAITASMDEKEIMGLNFPDLTQGIAAAKKIAAGRPMGFVRDVGDAYVYAAIGGNLEVGPNYAPDLFVCVHDGMRPDKKTLGFKFEPGSGGWRPKDVSSAMSNISPDASSLEAVKAAAQALYDEYTGRNTYQYLVDKVKEGALPAGTAAAVVAAAPPAAASAPPAAAAESPQIVKDALAIINAPPASDSKAAPGSTPVKKGLGAWLSGVKGKFKRSPSAKTKGDEAEEPQQAAKQVQDTARKAKKSLFTGGSEVLIIDAMREDGDQRIIRDAVRVISNRNYSDRVMQELIRVPWDQNPAAGRDVGLPGVKKGPFASKRVIDQGPVAWTEYSGNQDQTRKTVTTVTSSARGFMILQAELRRLMGAFDFPVELINSDDEYTKAIVEIYTRYPALLSIIIHLGYSLPVYDNSSSFTRIDDKVWPVFDAAAKTLGIELPREVGGRNPTPFSSVERKAK
jgi:hypothetical protein